MTQIQEHPEIARVLATGEVARRQRIMAADEDRAYEERRERELLENTDPCLQCRRRKRCDNGCQSWQTYYLHRQGKITDFAQKLWRGEVSCPVERREERDVFAYSHPELVRRYIRKHPCEGCLLKPGCKTPCSRYLHWYDARMEVARNILQ